VTLRQRDDGSSEVMLLTPADVMIWRVTLTHAPFKVMEMALAVALDSIGALVPTEDR